MPSASRVLGTGKTLKVEIPLPKETIIDYVVSSSAPVDVKLVDQSGLGEFVAGKNPAVRGGGEKQELIKQMLHLEPGKYYLLISNTSNDPVTFTYGVYF